MEWGMKIAVVEVVPFDLGRLQHNQEDKDGNTDLDNHLMVIVELVEVVGIA